MVSSKQILPTRTTSLDNVWIDIFTGKCSVKLVALCINITVRILENNKTTSQYP